MTPTVASCPVTVQDYRVLFADDRYPASGISTVRSGGRLLLTLQQASDGEQGIATLLTHSDDFGNTWSEPAHVGPPLDDPTVEFQAVALAHTLPDQRIVSCSVHLQRGFDRSVPQNLYRPGELLIGHGDPKLLEFTWRRFASGTFLDEQFVAPGLQLRSGRILFTLWGSATIDDNWQCGVLLSDDGGETLRYRQVGYPPDKSIRRKSDVVAGFNEQTLFALSPNEVVSIIRGRDHLGEVPEVHPRSSECLFFRSVSQDGGETWSPPQLTNLPGTGAPSTGAVLPDGSMLLPARIPTTWSRHENHALCGLSLARSFDKGLTWQPELVVSRTPKGELSDNYYNAMNGAFVEVAPSEVLYVFGHFRRGSRSGHDVYGLQLSWSS